MTKRALVLAVVLVSVVPSSVYALDECDTVEEISIDCDFWLMLWRGLGKMPPISHVCQIGDGVDPVPTGGPDEGAAAQGQRSPSSTSAIRSQTTSAILPDFSRSPREPVKRLKRVSE